MMKKRILSKLAAMAAIACLLLSNCGGGFGADCDNAKDLGPGIFGPDSVRR